MCCNLFFISEPGIILNGCCFCLVEFSQGLCQSQLSIITGRGNRSQGGVARLRPAVLDYLKIITTGILTASIVFECYIQSVAKMIRTLEFSPDKKWFLVGVCNLYRL